MVMPAECIEYFNSSRTYLQFILTLWLGTVKENGADTAAEGSTRGKWGADLTGMRQKPPHISRAFSILNGQCHLEPVVPFALDLHRIWRMILNEDFGTSLLLLDVDGRCG